MAPFSVQGLVGKRVIVHLDAPVGEYWATISAVRTLYASEVEADAINFSTFALKLDDGRDTVAAGTELSQL